MKQFSIDFHVKKSNFTPKITNHVLILLLYLFIKATLERVGVKSAVLILVELKEVFFLLIVR